MPRSDRFSQGENESFGSQGGARARAGIKSKTQEGAQGVTGGEGKAKGQMLKAKAEGGVESRTMSGERLPPEKSVTTSHLWFC